MDELYQRLDLAVMQVNTIKNKVARHDLIKMIRTVDSAMTAADQELVECRRLHRETIPYREAVQRTRSLIDNLEKHITFAALIG